jgi:hypothetical protein
MPAPLIVKSTLDEAAAGSAVILKLLAPGSKTMDATSVELAERERFVVLEVAKVAMSLGPFGTVAGVQFAAVFQSPVLGLTFQVALPANEWAAIMHESMQTAGKSLFILRSQQKAAPISRQYG